MSIDIGEYLEVHNMTYLHGHLSYFGYDATPIIIAYFAIGECFAPQPMHLQRRDASLFKVKFIHKIDSVAIVLLLLTVFQ